MKRLFLTLPESWPDKLDGIVWRMSGQAAPAPDLPPPLSAADEIWLALPASRVLLGQIGLSRRALRQLNGNLANALEGRLMVDPAGVHVALASPLEDDVYPVAVIDRIWLQQVLAWCQNHGVKLAGAIPETLLWRLEAMPASWSVRWNGHAGFVRTGAVAGFALDDGSALAPPLALQLALAEARRENVAPSAVVVETVESVDATAWSRMLGCPVYPQPLQFDTRMPAINLLQGRFKPGRRGWLDARQMGRYRLAAGLLLAAISVHVLGGMADWARLSWENRQLHAEMHQVFQDTFPQTQSIVDPGLQMRRLLADLRHTRGYAETGDFLHALGVFGDQAGSQVGGVSRLSYADGRLELKQADATDLDRLRSALASQGYRLTAVGEAERQTLILERLQP